MCIRDRAKRLRLKIKQDVVTGKADPTEAAHHLLQLDMASTHRTKQQRRLITPEELMGLNDHQQLLLVSGLDLPPILAQKFSYFSRAARREMAGKYLDTPYHSAPKGKEGCVRVHHWYGARWHKIIRADTPKIFREFPQFRDGSWEYLDGFYGH